MAEAVLDTKSMRRDTAFFGHPIGLGWLAFSELWERFSFYGMLSILPLYLVHFLLQPGRTEHVIGFPAMTAVLAVFYGAAVTPQALAAHITGFYQSSVYATPLVGGLLADRFLGRTNSVTIGALLMAFGHFLMAFQASFVLALLCLIHRGGILQGQHRFAGRKPVRR